MDDQYFDELRERLRASSLDLRRTVTAVKCGRRTPEQVKAVIDRARRAVYRSTLIRRKYARHRRVH